MMNTSIISNATDFSMKSSPSIIKENIRELSSSSLPMNFNLKKHYPGITFLLINKYDRLLFSLGSKMNNDEELFFSNLVIKTMASSESLGSKFDYSQSNGIRNSNTLTNHTMTQYYTNRTLIISSVYMHDRIRDYYNNVFYNNNSSQSGSPYNARKSRPAMKFHDAQLFYLVGVTKNKIYSVDSAKVLNRKAVDLMMKKLE